MRAGVYLRIQNHMAHVIGVSHTLPRYPPRPLLYLRLSLMNRILPDAPPLTFVLVRPQPGVSPAKLAQRIERGTGFKALTREKFIVSSLWWVFANSEDVGDMTAMLMLALLVGSGVSGILLGLFVLEHLHYYALFKALGAGDRALRSMVLIALLATWLSLRPVWKLVPADVLRTF